jgi:hypothetical protein
MMHVWWPFLKHAINQKIINKVNSLLETQSPPFVSSIELSRFDLGEGKPYIASIDVSSNGIGSKDESGTRSAGEGSQVASGEAEGATDSDGTSSSPSDSAEPGTSGSASSSTDRAAGGEGVERVAGRAPGEGQKAAGEGSRGKENGAGGKAQNEGVPSGGADTQAIDEEQLVIDITFGFTAGADQIAELSIMTDAGFETTVSVQNIVLHPATARIVLHPLKKEMPTFGGVSACFMEKPSIEFDFNFSGLAVTSLPFVAEWLQGFIKNSISSGLIFPQFKHVSTTPAAPAADTEEAVEERDVAKTYMLTIQLGEGTGFEEEEEEEEEEEGVEEDVEKKEEDVEKKEDSVIDVDDAGANGGDAQKEKAKKEKARKEVKTMTVRVPPGTSVGDELTVTTSDGRMVNVVIPEGARVGQKFKVRCLVHCCCHAIHHCSSFAGRSAGGQESNSRRREQRSQGGREGHRG